VKSILNQGYPYLISFELLVWTNQDKIWEKALTKKIGNDSIESDLDIAEVSLKMIE